MTEKTFDKLIIGDRVIIKENLIPGEKYGDALFVMGMHKYCGSICKISSFDMDGSIRVYNGYGEDYYFSREMIKSRSLNSGDKNMTQKEFRKLKVGDKIKI